MSADLRARLAAAWDGATGGVEHLADAPGVPPGFTMWRVGRSSVVLPALAADAPLEVRERYLARVVATATGTCPLCAAVACLGDADPQRTPGAWAVLPVTLSVPHTTGCPAVFGDQDKRFFDPRAVQR